MSLAWQQWEKELLERERTWEQKQAPWRYTPNAPDREYGEVSVWWQVVGSVIMLTCVAMAATAFWAVFLR
jgi:hypothetical protein